MNKKAIVTGGAGFIGSHIVDELVKRGAEVVVIDDFSTGKEENKNPGATYHNLDIRSLEDIKPLFKGVDYVFHLAAMPQVQVSIETPNITNEINVGGMLNVLIASRDAKVKRLIFSASSSVYGEVDIFPQKETSGIAPISPYGLEKYIGELQCQIFSRIYGLQTVCLRYFNVFGLRQNAEGAYALVMARFLEQKAKGEPLTIVPSGKQTRDFVHVSDVVRANLLAATSDKVGKGEAMNVGTGVDRSVLDIAGIIGGPTVFIEPRLEPQKTLADNTKAKELLGWSPQVTLEQGLEELLESLK